MSVDHISLNSKMQFKFFEAVWALFASPSAPCTEQLAFVRVLEHCLILKGKSFQLSSNVLKHSMHRPGSTKSSGRQNSAKGSTTRIRNAAAASQLSVLNQEWEWMVRRSLPSADGSSHGQTHRRTALAPNVDGCVCMRPGIGLFRMFCSPWLHVLSPRVVRASFVMLDYKGLYARWMGLSYTH